MSCAPRTCTEQLSHACWQRHRVFMAVTRVIWCAGSLIRTNSLYTGPRLGCSHNSPLSRSRRATESPAALTARASRNLGCCATSPGATAAAAGSLPVVLSHQSIIGAHYQCRRCLKRCAREELGAAPRSPLSIFSAAPDGPRCALLWGWDAPARACTRPINSGKVRPWAFVDDTGPPSASAWALAGRRAWRAARARARGRHGRLWPGRRGAPRALGRARARRAFRPPPAARGAARARR